MSARQTHKVVRPYTVKKEGSPRQNRGISTRHQHRLATANAFAATIIAASGGLQNSCDGFVPDVDEMMCQVREIVRLVIEDLSIEPRPAP